MEIRSRPVTARCVNARKFAPGGIVVAINVAPPWVDAAGERQNEMSGKRRTLTASLEGAIKAGARPRAFLALGRVQHEMVQMDHDAITSVPQSIGWVKNPGRTSARVAGKIRTRDRKSTRL